MARQVGGEGTAGTQLAATAPVLNHLPSYAANQGGREGQPTNSITPKRGPHTAATRCPAPTPFKRRANHPPPRPQLPGPYSGGCSARQLGDVKFPLRVLNSVVIPPPASGNCESRFGFSIPWASRIAWRSRGVFAFLSSSSSAGFSSKAITCGSKHLD